MNCLKINKLIDTQQTSSRMTKYVNHGHRPSSSLIQLEAHYFSSNVVKQKSVFLWKSSPHILKWLNLVFVELCRAFTEFA